MRLSLMEWLDKYGGMAPDYLLTLLLRHKKQPATDGPLIILKLFGMGSVILILEALQRQSIKNRTIYLITFKENQAAVSALFTVPISFLTIRNDTLFHFILDYLSTLLSLRLIGGARLIDFEFFSRATSIFCKLAAILYGTTISGFWDRDLPRSRGYHCGFFFQDHRHIRDSYCHAFAVNGLTPDNTGQILSTPLTIRDPSCIIINCNASDLALGRRWPAAHFSSLIELILVHYPTIKISLTGSPAERSYTQSVYNAVTNQRERISLCAGRQTITEFIDLLTRSMLFITNDSGPFHIARHLQTPTLTIWGLSSPVMLGPDDNTLHESIWQEFPCSPCMCRRGYDAGLFCNKDYTCITSIPVEMVFDRLRSHYERLVQNQPHNRSC